MTRCPTRYYAPVHGTLFVFIARICCLFDWVIANLRCLTPVFPLWVDTPLLIYPLLRYARLRNVVVITRCCLPVVLVRRCLCTLNPGGYCCVVTSRWAEPSLTLLMALLPGGAQLL